MAVITAVPVVRPMTNPSEDTEATPGQLLLHVTGGSYPSCGVTVACSCSVENKGMFADDWSSVTIWSTTLTLQVAEASPALAVMVHSPLPTAVTNPISLTVATLLLLVLHVTLGAWSSSGDTVAFKWYSSPFSITILVSSKVTV